MKLLSRIAVVMLLAGCVANGELKGPAEMQPRERAAFVLMLYNNADTNYRVQFEETSKPLSEDMKTYFRKYKSTLEGAAPVIRLYVDTVTLGAKPSPEAEENMVRLIYKLQALLSGGKHGS